MGVHIPTDAHKCQTTRNIMCDNDTLRDPGMSLINYIDMDMVRRRPALAQAIMEYEKQFIITVYALVKDAEEKKKRKKRRSVWVRPYLLRRRTHGHYGNLMKELAVEDPVLYRNFTRVEEELFNEIVERLRPHIEKTRTFMREPLDVGVRVAITLRFLATGNSYKSLGYAFRVAPNTISKIVPDTCKAIVTEFGEEYMRLPYSAEGWKKVARGFQERWNFPNTIGAMDGKHIRIKNPDFAGTHYYNYKKFFSVVLLAVVDSDYKFMYIDVGAIGSESDAGVFAQSRLAAFLHSNEANLPAAKPLPGDTTGRLVEHFLLGDDAFTLKPWLMKPYPSRSLSHDQRVFNYRLSRARRVVENAFGILANK